MRPWLVFTALLAACSSDPTVPIGAPDAASSADGATTDAAALDASAGRDAESVDARPLADASAPDATADAATSLDSAVQDAAAVDAAVALDAGGLDASATDGATSDAGPTTACLVDGIYGTSFSGMVVYFSFDLASGRWGASETRADLPANPLLAGSFTFSGNVLGLEEDPGESCPPGVATYTTVFNATCMQFTLEVIADPCAKRAMALDRAVFTL